MPGFSVSPATAGQKTEPPAKKRKKWRTCSHHPYVQPSVTLTLLIHKDLFSSPIHTAFSHINPFDSWPVQIRGSEAVPPVLVKITQCSLRHSVVNELILTETVWSASIKDLVGEWVNADPKWPHGNGICQYNLQGSVVNRLKLNPNDYILQGLIVNRSTLATPAWNNCVCISLRHGANELTRPPKMTVENITTKLGGEWVNNDPHCVECITISTWFGGEWVIIDPKWLCRMYATVYHVWYN